MSKQPEALRLADLLDVAEISKTGMNHSADELRRLHALNGELLEVLSSLLAMCKRQHDFNDDGDGLMFDRALSVIAKAEAA